MSELQQFNGYVAESDLPIRKGETVTIPAGIAIHRPTAPASMPKQVASKRAQRVTVHHVLPGSNLIDRNGTPASDPKIVWVGSGGYWCEVLFSDLAKAGAIPVND